MTIRHKIIKNKHGCGWGKAADVAQAIATKAFEHLTRPLEEQEHKFVERVYQRLLKNCGLTPAKVEQLVTHNIGCMNTDVTIDITDSSGNEITVTSHNPIEDSEPFFVSHWRGNLTIAQNDLYDEAVELRRVRNALGQKMDELKESLTAQVNNRSTKEVMRDWPEAWPIVAEVMEIELNKPPLFVPLEQLMAKFLPMLPAPK